MKFIVGNEERFFEYLKQEDPENRFCFECHAQPTSWASISLGIFLCLKCAGLHRGLGVNISFVRSTNLDKWKPRQAEQMRLGGNSRAKAFFASINENPKSENDVLLQGSQLQRLLEDRYSSSEAMRYQNKLKSEVSNALGPDESNIEHHITSKKYSNHVTAISSDGYVPKPQESSKCCCTIC